jgi:hypothetical protein
MDMLADSVIEITTNSSTDQQVVSPNSSAKLFITLFASDLEIIIERLWDIDFSTDSIGIRRSLYSEAYLTMLASESVLSRDWDQPEEDEAWIDL